MQIVAEVIGRREAPSSWVACKRLVDVVFGGMLLLSALPVIALAAIAICLFEGGSPIYAQERVGMHGRRFKMYKLRTMVEGAHQMREHLGHLNERDGPVFKITDDPRCHPLGRMLRRFSIDELPNFVNVIRGEMSLVGPRPALPSEIEHYDAAARRRLTVPQGVTGIWQISARYRRVSFQEWIEMDNRYIDEWTPLGDLAIIARTIPAIFHREAAR
jgi:lipopolysaccharide/colanic/teichoic acid biosynthesis glycosyltransferase